MLPESNSSYIVAELKKKKLIPSIEFIWKLHLFCACIKIMIWLEFINKQKQKLFVLFIIIKNYIFGYEYRIPFLITSF